MLLTKSRALDFLVLLLFLLIAAAFVLLKAPRKTTAPEQSPALVAQPIDDSFWLNLDRRRVDKYRQQLQSAPQVLVVRETHYVFNPANGMGAHYGWIDRKMANLHVSFPELVAYAYGGQRSRTEFPKEWSEGRLTNAFDVIVTITNRPQEALQAEARKLLRQQFGLAWHPSSRSTQVLLLRALDRDLLESKTDVEFANSKSIPEFISELENYFSKPVIDETGATNRYDKRIGLVPARWIDGRTTNLDANNKFLQTVGLQLVPANRSQEWLLMDTVR